MAIKKKNKVESSSTPKKQIIKVDPYENPENVMELMASICSAIPTADMDLFWNMIYDAYNKEVKGKSLKNYLTENREKLFNKDFAIELNEFCEQLAWSLATRENTEHTQIVIAGGFSSGKSSFLNRITNCTNLLPTGVEPVSVIKTYLYCSRNSQSVLVKGVNQKNVLVNLNPRVLQAIQHSKKSNIYLASVLDKLFVEIPSKNLDGIVFIDTPGYNNSDKANLSNGKTDRETAIEALREGNVLFWLIDCERGTTVSNDIEIIKQFNGKKVIIFNKSDKKGYRECIKIVDEAATTLYKEFPKNEIIDIIAYSTLDNCIYYSKNNMSLETIIQESKKSGNGSKELESLKERIGTLFDEEIKASQRVIKDIEEKYGNYVERKDEGQRNYQNAKDRQDHLVSYLNMFIESYSNVSTAASQLWSLNGYTVDTFIDFYNEILKSDVKGFFARPSDSFWDAIKKAHSEFDIIENKRKAVQEYTYWDEEERKDLVEWVNNEEDFIVERWKEFYEIACEDCENILKGRIQEQIIIKDMQEYRRLFMAAIELGVREYQKNNKATIVHNEKDYISNVFDCIKKDDYKSFLHNFEDGVDLSISNTDGYNPLTLAIQMGNNMMVQFMIDHDADPSIKDKRGYNAFHTAVENQYRDICKMLLDTDPELIDTKTASGESVLDLAKKHTFTKWIENEIDNAF